jgi:hypothetical protein
MNRLTGWLRRIKNWYGKRTGAGCCLSCGDRWSWKEWKEIPYAVTQAMFPVCKECFDNLSAEDILGYCYQLLMSWHEENTWHDREPLLYAAIGHLKAGFDLQDVERKVFGLVQVNIRMEGEDDEDNENATQV